MCGGVGCTCGPAPWIEVFSHSATISWKCFNFLPHGKRKKSQRQIRDKHVASQNKTRIWNLDGGF